MYKSFLFKQFYGCGDHFSSVSMQSTFYWGRPDVSKIQGLIGSPESLGSKSNVYKRELKKQNIKKPNAVGIF